jgi:hypothetical protein
MTYDNDGPIYSVLTGKGCDENSYPCRIRWGASNIGNWTGGGSNCAVDGTDCCVSWALEYAMYYGENGSGNTQYILWSNPTAPIPNQNGIVTTDISLATQNATAYCNACVNFAMEPPDSEIQC